jgi:transcriptional regulator with XRE-family HTH domain
MTEYRSRIRGVRTARGLTQKQLAESLGVGARAVRKWELGRAGFGQFVLAYELCRVLGCRIEDLVEETDEH